MTDQTINPVSDADGALTDADDTVVINTGSSSTGANLFDALLDQGFDEDSAQEMSRTATATPSNVISSIQGNIDPDTLPQRVALSTVMLDDTKSAELRVLVGDDPSDPEHYTTVIAMVTRAHDALLDTVQKVTADEPVEILASASWLNGQPSTIYPYTPIANAPRLSGRHVQLFGRTAWLDRNSQMLTGTAQEMETLEMAGKTVYGLAGLVTDGFDNASEIHTLSSHAKVVRGFRRMKTLVPYVIYTGAMPKPGTFGRIEREGGRYGDLYESECRYIRRVLNHMEVDDLELVTADSTLEDLVRAIFIAAGYDPAMVFLPGQDPRAIVKAFVTVSKLMATVSRGQMPQGLSAI